MRRAVIGDRCTAREAARRDMAACGDTCVGDDGRWKFRARRHRGGIPVPQLTQRRDTSRMCRAAA